MAYNLVQSGLATVTSLQADVLLVNRAQRLPCLLIRARLQMRLPPIDRVANHVSDTSITAGKCPPRETSRCFAVSQCPYLTRPCQSSYKLPFLHTLQSEARHPNGDFNRKTTFGWRSLAVPLFSPHGKRSAVRPAGAGTKRNDRCQNRAHS